MGISGTQPVEFTLHIHFVSAALKASAGLCMYFGIFDVCVCDSFVWVYFSKKKHRVIYGKWTECVYSIEPKVYEANKKAEKKSGGDSKKHKQVKSVKSFISYCRAVIYFLFCFHMEVQKGSHASSNRGFTTYHNRDCLQTLRREQPTEKVSRSLLKHKKISTRASSFHCVLSRIQTNSFFSLNLFISIEYKLIIHYCSNVYGL